MTFDLYSRGRDLGVIGTFQWGVTPSSGLSKKPFLN